MFRNSSIHKINTLFNVLTVNLLMFLGCLSTHISAQEAIVPFKPTPEQLVGVSPVIFSGIVTELRYGKHEHSKMPYTFIKFAGVEYLRKDSEVSTEKGNTLEISVAGGIRDNLRIMEVDELPKFDLGERYLIFLRGGQWRFSPIAAFETGVFKLHGRLADDAILLNNLGQPIAEITTERMVMSRDLSKTVNKHLVELPANSRLESTLRAQSGTAPKSVDEERRLEEMAGSGVLKQSSEPEKDNKRGRFAAFDKLFRVSQLKQFIETSVKNTEGKYEAFSRLHLEPAFIFGSGFTPVIPKTQEKVEPVKSSAKLNTLTLIRK